MKGKKATGIFVNALCASLLAKPTLTVGAAVRSGQSIVLITAVFTLFIISIVSIGHPVVVTAAFINY